MPKHQITMTASRVTAKTKTPFLAKVEKFGRTPLIIFVPEIVRYQDMPPFARATIICGFPKSEYFETGMTMVVNNFKCLTRIEFSDIPHTSPFAPRPSATSASLR